MKPEQENVRQLLARCGYSQDEAESTTLIQKLPKNKLVLNIVLCTRNGLHFFRSLRKIPHLKIFYRVLTLLLTIRATWKCLVLKQNASVQILETNPILIFHGKFKHHTYGL